MSKKRRKRRAKEWSKRCVHYRGRGVIVGKAICGVKRPSDHTSIFSKVTCKRCKKVMRARRKKKK